MIKTDSNCHLEQVLKASELTDAFRVVHIGNFLRTIIWSRFKVRTDLEGGAVAKKFQQLFQTQSKGAKWSFMIVDTFVFDDHQDTDTNC